MCMNYISKERNLCLGKRLSDMSLQQNLRLFVESVLGNQGLDYEGKGSHEFLSSFEGKNWFGK